MTVQYDFDLVVVGGGHAGVEAALAAARLGARTALLSTNLDTIAQMSCNPAIGGVGKGQIVREIDALGGLMGQAIDATGLQFRMLNRRKGPAMHGPRAQADKKAYQRFAKRALEEHPLVWLRQETAEDLLVETGGERPRVVGVRVAGDAVYRAGAVVLCAGTFMRGLLHVGNETAPGGRMGEAANGGISQALERLGLRVERFKTGTPARLNGRTIDYEQMEHQPGDDVPEPFSFLNERIDCQQMPCWITYTSESTHELIRQNLDRSPMFSGQIQSIGPRYCPSIETKVIRFADKSRHQLFIEPEGRDTHEVYLNGLSTSLPRDVQDVLVRSIAGLHRAQIVRYGYAIEYDYLPPQQLRPSLETKQVAGLYLAGQINGTTGYEEAAGLGLLAGANAALSLAGREPLVLRRDEAYLGVMVDDLVTRGVDEPYRMFTSRAEYRLQLRHDNADRRLTQVGYERGLVPQERYEQFTRKEAAISQVARLLEETRLGQTPLARILRRPETTWQHLVAALPELADVPPRIAEQVQHDALYSGYLARQHADIARQQRLAERQIPTAIDYGRIGHLRAEAREKFERVRPLDLAHAGRISGITPADVAVLAIYLAKGSEGSA